MTILEAMLGGKKYKGKENPNNSHDTASSKSALKYHSAKARGYQKRTDKAFASMGKSGEGSAKAWGSVAKNSHKFKRHIQASHAAKELAKNESVEQFLSGDLQGFTKSFAASMAEKVTALATAKKKDIAQTYFAQEE